MAPGLVSQCTLGLLSFTRFFTEIARKVAFSSWKCQNFIGWNASAAEAVPLEWFFFFPAAPGKDGVFCARAVYAIVGQTETLCRELRETRVTLFTRDGYYEGTPAPQALDVDVAASREDKPFVAAFELQTEVPTTQGF